MRNGRVARNTTSTVSGVPQKLNIVVYAASLPAQRHTTRLDVPFFIIGIIMIIMIVVVVLAYHGAFRDYTEAGSISSNTIAARVTSSMARSEIKKTCRCGCIYLNTGSIWV
jgi:hypothetical protein